MSDLFTDEGLAYAKQKVDEANLLRNNGTSVFTDEALDYASQRVEEAKFNYVKPTPSIYTQQKQLSVHSKINLAEQTNETIKEFNLSPDFLALLIKHKNISLDEKGRQDFEEQAKFYTANGIALDKESVDLITSNIYFKRLKENFDLTKSERIKDMLNDFKFIENLSLDEIETLRKYRDNYEESQSSMFDIFDLMKRQATLAWETAELNKEFNERNGISFKDKKEEIDEAVNSSIFFSDKKEELRKMLVDFDIAKDDALTDTAELKQMSAEEYLNKKRALDFVYGREKDYEGFFNFPATILSNIASSIAHPIYDNPGTFALALLTRKPTIIAQHLAVTGTIDTIQQYKADLISNQIIEGKKQGKNISYEKAEEDVTPLLYAIGGLNYLANFITLGTLSKGSTQLYKTLTTKVGKNTPVSEITKKAEASSNLLKNSILPVVKPLAKDIGNVFATNMALGTVTETLAESKRQTDQGKEADVLDITKNVVEDIFSTNAVSALMFNAPSIASVGIRLNRLRKIQKDFIANTDTVTEMAKFNISTKDIKNDTPEMNEAYDRVIDGDIYINATDLKENFEESGYNINEMVELLPESFKDIISKAENGEDIVISKKDYAKLVIDSNEHQVIAPHIRATQDGKSNYQLNIEREALLKETVTPEHQKLIQEQKAKRKQDIKNLEERIQKDLTVSNVGSYKETKKIAKLITNVFTTMSDITGVDIETLASKRKVRFVLDKDEKTFGGKVNKSVGKFDPTDFVVHIKRKNDMPTLIHETAHYMFETIATLADEMPELSYLKDKIQKWTGHDKKWSELSKEQRAKIQEDFVYSLQEIMINPTKFDKNLAPFFDMFTKTLIKAYGADASILRKEYADRFGEQLKVDHEFVDFINTLVRKEEEVDQALADYPMDSLFDGTGVKGDEVEKIKQQYKQEEINIRAENKAGTMKMGAKIVQAGKQIMGFSKEKTAEYRAIFKANVERNRKLILEGGNTFDQEIINYRRNYNFLQTLRENIKLNAYKLEGLTKKQKELVRKLKITSKKEGDRHAEPLLALIKERFPEIDIDTKLKELAELPSLETFLKEKAARDLDNPRVNAIIEDAHYKLVGKAVTRTRLSIVKNENAILRNILKEKFGTTMSKIPRLARIQKMIDEDVSKLRMRGATPRSFLNHAKQARLNAKIALSKGNYEEAAKFNLLEQLYLEKLIKTTKLREQYNKKLTVLKSFYKRKQLKYDKDMLRIGSHLMAMVGLSSDAKIMTNTEKETLARLEPNIMELYNKVSNGELAGKNVNDMTFGEVEQLIKTLESIKYQASNTRKNYLLNQEASKNEMVEEMLNVLSTKKNKKQSIIKDGKASTTLPRYKILIDKLKYSFAEYTVKMESYLQGLDGKADGAFNNYIYKPMREAMTRFQIKSQATSRRLQQIIDNIDYESYKGEYRTGLKIPLLDGSVGELTFGTKGTKYADKARLDAMGILLHLGNKSNRQRLLDGYYWKEEELDAFINKAIDDGFITKNMMDAVQNIWDEYAKLNEDAQQAHKHLTGGFYKELEFTTIKTPFGEYKGGYVPAVDNKFIENSSRNKDIETIINESSIPRENVVTANLDGFTKERKQGVKTALSLDMEDLLAASTSIIKYSELVAPAKMVLNIINDPDLKDALSQKEPHARDLIVDWLQRTTQVQQSLTGDNAYAKALGLLTSKVGKSIMAANLTNVVQSLTNFFVAGVKVNSRYMLKNAVTTITEQDISTKSEFMKNRFENGQVLSSEIVKDILIGTSKFKRGLSYLDKNAYYFQKKVQDKIDRIVWMSAYQEFRDKNIKTIDDAILERKAVEHADSVIRTTQGSFDAIDLAKTEAHTPLVKALTQFSGYFLTLGNLIISENKIAKNELTGLKLMQRYAIIQMLAVIAPSITGEAIAKAMAGDLTKEDEDPDRIFNDNMSLLIGAPLRTYGAMIPIGGRLVSMAVDELSGKSFYNNSLFNIPVVTTTAAGYNSLKNLIMAGLDEGEFSGRDLRNIMAVFGIGAPYTNAIGQRLGVAYDLYNENYYSDDVYDSIRGLVVGKPSSEQKGM